MRVNRARAGIRIAVLPEHVAQPNLRGREGDTDDQNRNHELPVEGSAVVCNRRRKPPFLTGKINTDKNVRIQMITARARPIGYVSLINCPTNFSLSSSSTALFA